ncbi:MAG: hydrogenase expression protein HypE [Rhodopseudomonas sp.]|nr:hydrogenase expression protein HypE [Rhodopseudomonas sp.]
MIGPRSIVTEDGWRDAIARLASGRATLLGLWGDKPDVTMALLDEGTGKVDVFGYTCINGQYPSVGAQHPPAIRLERTIRDLQGLDAIGCSDRRPWLTHDDEPYAFLPTEGDALHQIAVGPVHAGIIEPGHFRFTANGEFVVRLEQRLGYVHKGIEGLMTGATLDTAARLAARVSGDSTVAYSYAFALAAETASQIAPPPRAVYLRALMAEFERLANHLGDIGAVCNDAAFALMHAQTGILRERVLRASQDCFGHRLMMDIIVPGGVARDIAPDGVKQIGDLLAEIRRIFPHLVSVYDNTASLQDRTVGTGIVKPEFARQFGAGGFVGRASGRAFDARRALAYAPYDRLTFDVPVLSAGDVNARIWIRIREVEQSLALIDQIVGALPDGATKIELPPHGACEGLALAEAFRGDALVWLRLDDQGRVARCHLRDASWFQWPLLETAIDGNIVADFPLCNKSFNCSYAGHDA